MSHSDAVISIQSTLEQNVIEIVAPDLDYSLMCRSRFLLDHVFGIKKLCDELEPCFSSALDSIKSHIFGTHVVTELQLHNSAGR